ncbi:MAG: hypothetical protein GTO24_21165 [candidate division Zixibacteria bacterium]|nr:hypothetical protein [candidate division Zixibacteria bacterium]
MKETFVDKSFRSNTLRVIEWVNDILAKYGAMGYDLTTRQVYYQLVAQDLIPNDPKSYNRIKGIVSDGRLAGLIDWAMIVDRTRKVIIPSRWKDPAEIVKQAAKQFRIDKWERQPRHVEVMVEKQALEGILTPVCRDLDIPFTANKGYSSSSAMYRAGKRLFKAFLAGKELFVLYLGDHDPSGIDMDRDILERLEMFSTVHLDVTRLALLMDQIETMDIPENPAKVSDSRYAGYVATFGPASWELDAMEPTELASVVTEAVENLRDEDLWQEALDEEKEMKDELWEFVNDYEERESNDGSA